MKYVLLGKLNPEWFTRSNQRIEAAKRKLGTLGIKLESFYYTQGAYDFVDVVDAADAEAMLAFSLWYAQQGYGSITTMPAFTSADMEHALNKMKG
ncbi:MAG: GYD domain-containing protein [Alphaproteobacteria bacterium]|nr:GYD domain-containing protein [Alphaproteobacteria bacterium]